MSLPTPPSSPSSPSSPKRVPRRITAEIPALPASDVARIRAWTADYGMFSRMALDLAHDGLSRRLGALEEEMITAWFERCTVLRLMTWAVQHHLTPPVRVPMMDEPRPMTNAEIEALLVELDERKKRGRDAP